MQTTTETEVTKTPTRDGAVWAWENAVYRRRHVLAQYGADSAVFERAKRDVVLAWGDVEKAIPAGSACVVRGRRFEWVEGELVVGA